MVQTTSFLSGRKYTFVGSAACGKSSLIHRALSDAFTSEYLATLGADLFIKTDSSGKKPPVQIWCCSGQERFRPLVSQFLSEANAIIICFDMLDQVSFNETQYWINEAKRLTPDAVIILCGTKADEVDTLIIKPQDALKYAGDLGIEFRQISSKTGANVNELFEFLSAKVK